MLKKFARDLLTGFTREVTRKLRVAVLKILISLFSSIDRSIKAYAGD